MDGVACADQIKQTLGEERPVVIMVTAFGRDEAMASATEHALQVRSILTKPVTPSTLLEAIGVAAGREISVETRAHEKSDDQTADMARLAGSRLLLVEDNEMNRELAVELLNQAGIEVAVAAHGREALDLLDTGAQFDGILMDCQMPVMDGYTATREIRRRPDGASLPIIAMTANAMDGDREKVLAVGMNDHIAKPLNVAVMFATIARWVHPAHPVALTVSPVNDGERAPPELRLPGVNTAAGLAVTQGDRALYARLLRKFREANLEFPARFEAAQADRDPSAAERLAHSLKGTAGNIGAHEIQSAAADLETACRRDDAVLAATSIERIRRLLAPLLDAIERLPAEELPRPATSGFERVAALGTAQRLAASLAANDSRATDEASQLAGLLQGSPLQSAAKEVLAAIEGYDFDDAAARLRPLLERLSTKG